MSLTRTVTSLVRPSLFLCSTALSPLSRGPSSQQRHWETRRHYCQASGSPRILITGGLGQLGSGLAEVMREKYGNENIVLSDIRKPTSKILSQGPYVYADVLDLKHLHSIVVNYRIDWVIHFSALLSAIGEVDPQRALNVNVDGFHNIVELCSSHKLRLFCPSTIGAFGLDSPKVMCPDLTIQRPNTVYGVSKVHMELLGEYYHSKFGLDFRSLRFPGVLSADTAPGGGTTDYAVHIFHDIAATGRYECFLREDTLLPMIYLPDCIDSIMTFMEAPNDRLTLRTYNITAMSFTPGDLVEEMKKYYPNMEVTYEPDYRQNIADSWPQVLDDSRARSDWGWRSQYDLPTMTREMIDKISAFVKST